MVFSYVKSGPSSNVVDSSQIDSARSRIDTSAPKTEECPINGKMFTKQERDIWAGRRVLTAMVENNIEARPLSGMSRADVVYEAVAEGGITRFLGVFYCGAVAQDFRIAVIRSARVYYIKWAAEYGTNPLFMHWGGANNFGPNGAAKPKGDIAPKVDAYALLNKLEWVNGQYGNDLDGSRNFGYPALVRQPNRLSNTDAKYEHQPAALVDLVYQKAEERGWGYKDSDGNAWDEDFDPWTFADEKALSSPKASDISFKFWDNWQDYDVRWEYDAATNSYKRFNGGKPFVDFDFDNEQITAKNIVVQFVDEEISIDNEKHNYYENVGTGNAIIFYNGDVIEAIWKKPSITARTKFYDKAGAEIPFVRGEIWIEAVPTGNDINY